MMRHAELGADILAGNPALAPLVPLVRHHHERYNGTGYPDRLAGEAIPLGAAIIAVADTFDTMTTDRPYRKAPGWEAARDEIERCTGTQFHPGVVGAFLQAVRRPEWRAWPTETRVTAFGGRPAAPAAGADDANGHDLNLVARAMTMAGE
jgi:HD-GYP domain-containing protein (c-di-GMP phosphodiesterase class II)